MVDKRGAGSLKERVTFQERARLDDGHGNSQEEFVDRFTCWAGFTFLRGSETVIAARLEGRQPVVARVRSFGNTRLISTDWRMRDERTNRLYAVKSIAESDDRAFLDVACESGVAA